MMITGWIAHNKFPKCTFYQRRPDFGTLSCNCSMIDIRHDGFTLDTAAPAAQSCVYGQFNIIFICTICGLRQRESGWCEDDELLISCAISKSCHLQLTESM
ncbi:hypothetical protein RvY_12552 [Ramazzottius varieornatus]|uniref:Uncharacterized protein n=1 Tax=Ramazzottius varieornatus TaxID=947166 RepID=A0A1D1VJX8_RAMVA|nr:hypothetical protein RvY_12552 [Ramazzottius varieornatus]